MSNKIINKLISILNNQDLDALALVPGSNFRYVTGGNFHLMERPTLFIVSKICRPIAILPVLEVESFTQLNIEADIVEWQDSDGYQSAFDKVFDKLGSIAKIGVEGQRMRVIEMQAIEKSFQNITIVNAQKLISNMRLIKDDQEIEHLKHAVKIAESALTDTIKFVSINKTEIEIASRILKEIEDRLGFLVNVGLNYLSLSRSSGTLSGGESQRIRLASQIGSGLTGVLYVLDEPSIGLHQKDNDRLLQTLIGLKDLGNTVIVVEHDEEAMLKADFIIDIGPEAGVNGGKIIASGDINDIRESENSLTGKYLSKKLKINVPIKRRVVSNGGHLIVNGACGNNLKNIDVKFPLGTLTCVTGVSGGGKSTLVLETLWKGLSREINKSKNIPLKHQSIEGLHYIDKIVDINQSPIGRTPRSNPATYTGAFTPIREWFSSLPESKARGYSPGRFSFNVKGGRCQGCQGDGLIKIEMHFLPDIYVQCDQCKGKRYNRETLEILWRGKSISDVLEMTVSEGLDFFKAIPSIKDKLETMNRVGLGYIKIGQQATTLSGGEAQRIKLSKELSKRATGKTVYILDEPTTGLHFEDIKKLLEVLDQLVSYGNTVIVIEHNLDVIKTSDWIIDLGPEGGNRGGRLVVEGPPELVAKCRKSHTGQFLNRIFSQR